MLRRLNNKLPITKSGFTLIELLVVIAVIAILAALLMSSLASAKLKAYQIDCLNNTKQLALMALMYQQDYGKGVPRDVNGTPSWFRQSGTSYIDVPDIRICPLAKKPQPGPDGPVEGGRFGVVAGTAANCWRIVTDGNPAHDETGSYAINDWFESQTGATPITQGGETNYFRYASSVKYPAQTPLFADSVWALVTPNPNDGVTLDLFRGVPGVEDMTPGVMADVTITRHGSKPPASAPHLRGPGTSLPNNWGINVSFEDGHAALAKLPDLWSLTWNRNWNSSGKPLVPAPF